MSEKLPRIPFNRPHIVGSELDYIRQAVENMHLASSGGFALRCQRWLETQIGCARALLTHTCTAALELAALLIDAGPGDEIIMPSFTFVSTANAFALRGATPVFVDIRPDTLNLDEARVEEAVTDATRAIVPVHYAGVGCEMDVLSDIARRRRLIVIEDAAHAVWAWYRGRALGALGDLAALSFHETKSVICGEGGALLINDERWIKRAEVLAEKGTDRSAFRRGELERYQWMDLGSSYLMSELGAAFLWAQLQAAQAITETRLGLWRRYHAAFEELERRGALRRPIVPPDARHNAHMYYLLLPNQAVRDRLIAALDRAGVRAVFHYVPLHSAPAGVRYGRPSGRLVHTDDVSARLIRLPMWTSMRDPDVDRVVCVVHETLAGE